LFDFGADDEAGAHEPGDVCRVLRVICNCEGIGVCGFAIISHDSGDGREQDAFAVGAGSVAEKHSMFACIACQGISEYFLNIADKFQTFLKYIDEKLCE
jgi:hypothetical protein